MKTWQAFLVGAGVAIFLAGLVFISAYAFSSGSSISSSGTPSAVNAAGRSQVTLQAPNLFADAGFVIIRGHNCSYELASDVSGNLAVSTTAGGSCGGGNEILTVNNATIATSLLVGTAFTTGNITLNAPTPANANVVAPGGFKIGSNFAPVVTTATVQNGIEVGSSLVSASPITFSPAFTAAPVCTCSDTAATATLVGCSATSTQLTLSGTSADTINWICIGTK